jgi:hypothetical protein
MACIRYYGVVPRDAGSWVGCWGCRSPLPRMQPMHACSSLGCAKVRVTRRNHACLTLTGRGMRVGRPRADMLRSWPTHKSPKERPYEPTAQSATHRRHLASRNTSSTAYTGGVRCQWRSAGLRGKLEILTQKKEGVTPFISPVRSACAPLTAHLRTCTPSPAYAQTFGCGGTCVHAPWGPQEPPRKNLFRLYDASLFGNTTA